MNSSPVTFFIDGEEMSAVPGQSILDVALEKGISIPTLCHHHTISKTTSCFVCVVKHTQTGRYLPSCAAAPQEGQNYESNSPDVFEMRQTALNLLLSEHTGDCEAPCNLSCPAHARVEEYVREGRKGNFLDTLKILKQRIPLPISIGRVCPRFCEKDCRRNIMDSPVAINDFKRLAADLFYESYLEECPPPGGRKVAIVGAGPAGLSIAYYLRLAGVRSDLYEAMPKPGGMLRYGIPEYRLPKSMLDKELAHFGKLGGIHIKCDKTLGKDFQISDLQHSYDAIAITVGCWKATPIRCEGQTLATDGISWLRQLAQNNWSGDNPRRTIVIGGGNTAMDCVRSAIRLGSEDVRCLYRRSEQQMPAEHLEVIEAREEGVKFEFLVAPVKIENRASNLLLTCLRMELGEADASGRRRPVPIEGTEFHIEADTIIAAIGQTPDVPSRIDTTKWGGVFASETDSRNRENIYAAGDCVTGAATVVEAVAGGRKVAMAILDRFNGRPHTEPPTINVSRGHWRSMATKDIVFLKEVPASKRLELSHISLQERQNTFNEVSRTASIDILQKEGERCLECSCTAKEYCTLKKHSEQYGASPDAISGEKLITDYDTRHPSIIHDRNKCIKCGICVKVCSEVINKNLLGYKNRGYTTEVVTAFERPLPDACGDCFECVNACPVGALDKRLKS
ncbi:MAG: FAD-dependent oxidoreductase [Deltaproteobacteria bacterium]|nr:FAD-dependent oxidoreductase [Deltaproteobacteria bacterium]